MSRFGIKKVDEEVTVDMLKMYFPTKSATITQELADTINEAQNAPDMAIEGFMENLVEFRGVMDKCQASMKEYIRAVKFCAFLEFTDYNITEAYKLSRINDKFVKDRWDAPTDSPKYRELTSAASRYYNKTNIVKQILLQADMPWHILFQGAKYTAMSVLMKEVTEAAYSRDRIAAAKEILAAVKRPENQKVELEIGFNDTVKSFQEQFDEKMSKMAEMQLKRLQSGETIKDVQKLDVIEAEYE
jgi:hypothetical protein